MGNVCEIPREKNKPEEKGMFVNAERFHYLCKLLGY
jgi:hypothetical protein